MKTLASLLFLLCLPSIIWHTPLSAEVKIAQTFSTYDDSIFSPWDLLNYENLSYDRIINFLNEIEYGEGLEKVMTEQQMDQVIDFLAFLTRNGIPDWNTDAKEKLEQDIAWLQGKPNQSELADETSKCPSLWWSNFNGYQDFKTVPTVLQGNEIEILLCKGWVAEKWKQTKKFSRNHKKTLIIATVVVVAATVVIAATGGAGTGAVAAAGTVGIAGTGSSSSDQEGSHHVNKPGDVKFQDEYDVEKPCPEFEAPLLWNPSELAFCPSQKEHRGSVLNLGESHKPSNTDAMKELIQGQSTFIKEDLSEQIPHEALNIVQKEVPSFWEKFVENGRKVGSILAHKGIEFGSNIAESVGPIGWALDDHPDRQPFNEFFEDEVLVYCDSLHEKIDQSFNTNYSRQYGTVARSALESSQTMSDLLKNLGKDVAFCFVPVPGSQLNKISKVAKTSKAIVEAAKAAGIVRGASAGASAVGSLLTTPSVTQEGTTFQREEGNITIYQSFNPKTGEAQYVGITNSVPRRSGEHKRNKGIEIQPLDNIPPLTKSDAKAVEQTLMEIYGLEKNGGTLINRINSIAKSNPEYAGSIVRGAEILAEAGYVE